MNYLSVSRVAFSIGSVDIYWYGVFITLAILIAFILSFVLSKRRGLNENISYEILIAIIPLGIICARLFSVIFEPDLTIADYFAFRQGGMSIIGAIIGGAIGITILCLIKKYNFLAIADMLVVVLILAQAIGRWGNFFNGEVYGQEILDSTWQFFPFAVEIDGLYYEALFFYEFVLNLIGFVGLFCLFWFTKQKGLATGGYLVYYGLVRTILEPRRQSEYILKLGSLPISQIMSIVMLIAGVIILTVAIVNIIKNKNNKGAKNEG